MAGNAAESSPAGSLTRRRWLVTGALGATGLAAGAGGAALLTRWSRPLPARQRWFTADEAALLTAVCERLIPRDDAPGATDTGVIHFIERQLRGPYRRHQTLYRDGLRALRAAALDATGVPFESLDSAGQDALLTRVEAGQAAAPGTAGPVLAEFFRLVLDHTMQGFYGPPRHGGNRNYASHRMLGLDYPQLAGRNRPRRPPP